MNDWYVGNKKESVSPLKLVDPLHVQHIGTGVNKNAGQATLRQMKCVMNQVEACAKIEEVYDSDPDKWTYEYAT